MPCTSGSSGSRVNNNGASPAHEVQDLNNVGAEEGPQYLDTRWRLVQVDGHGIDVASRHDLGYSRMCDWLGAPGVPVINWPIL